MTVTIAIVLGTIGCLMILACVCIVRLHFKIVHAEESARLWRVDFVKAKKDSDEAIRERNAAVAALEALKDRIIAEVEK